jgi:hypothetical protein
LGFVYRRRPDLHRRPIFLLQAARFATDSISMSVQQGMWYIRRQIQRDVCIDECTGPLAPRSHEAYCAYPLTRPATLSPDHGPIPPTWKVAVKLDKGASGTRFRLEGVVRLCHAPHCAGYAVHRASPWSLGIVTPTRRDFDTDAPRAHQRAARSTVDWSVRCAAADSDSLEFTPDPAVPVLSCAVSECKLCK